MNIREVPCVIELLPLNFPFSGKLRQHALPEEIPLQYAAHGGAAVATNNNIEGHRYAFLSLTQPKRPLSPANTAHSSRPKTSLCGAATPPT